MPTCDLGLAAGVAAAVARLIAADRVAAGWVRSDRPGAGEGCHREQTGHHAAVGLGGGMAAAAEEAGLAGGVAVATDEEGAETGVGDRAAHAAPVSENESGIERKMAEALPGEILHSVEENRGRDRVVEAVAVPET